MRHILTVHGINTDGKWQCEIKDVLEPHFRCHEIRYPHYRRFGAVKLLVEPWVFFPATLLLFGLWYAGYIVRPVVWFWGLGIVLVSHAASYIRRERALHCYMEQVKQAFPPPRHLIAHSLGTYLSGRIIAKHAWFKLDHVVLAGCVLKRKWQWRELLGYTAENRPGTGDSSVTSQPIASVKDPDSARVVILRNEVQRRDWVAFLAEGLRTPIRGFGMAGFGGFKETLPCPPETPTIHTVPRPDQACSSCSAGDKVEIHNIFCREYGHSDVFLSPAYAAYFWLPFFWDIQPTEYSRFSKLCVEAAEAAGDADAGGDKNFLKVEEIEIDLRGEWAWIGCTLSEFVRKQIVSNLKYSHQHRDEQTLNDLVDSAIRGIWFKFNMAKDAYHNRSLGWEKRIRALNPLIAVTTAVDDLLQP